MFPGGVEAGARDERVVDGLVELLTLTQRRATAALARDGGTATGYRLPGLALALPTPTVPRVVGATVDQALACRLPHPDDGRGVVVDLSGSGRDRLGREKAFVRAHGSALGASIDQERVAALVRALDELAADR